MAAVVVVIAVALGESGLCQRERYGADDEHVFCLHGDPPELLCE
jgi:hypothetical protein